MRVRRYQRIYGDLPNLVQSIHFAERVHARLGARQRGASGAASFPSMTSIKDWATARLPHVRTRLLARLCAPICPSLPVWAASPRRAGIG